jgi:guanine deaminase
MDLSLLRQAIELARVNGAEGQLPFGAVIANGADVVATGVNTALADNDPTAHGEVVAVRAACRELGTITRIVYAAPKEWVPDLGTPFAPVLFDIQAAARRLDPGRIEQIELPEAREPFTAFLASRK